ncbi:GNAT family N-acetyltransferase [Streptacidiphilus cavernicola]|uniref:GNAT family N-acetyltransferase n=1 Tax=Streptacidiphilus cavernicola TaxID=3342716 RepID=A0ABV6VR31_9ACTN
MKSRPKSEPRGARPGDLPAMRSVAAAALHLDQDGAELVDLLWDGPDTAPPLRVVAESDGEVVGVALGSLSTAGTGGGLRGHVNLIAVAPAAQGRGHGRALLAALERRLLDSGAETLVVRGSTPAYAWPGIDPRYTAAVCLAEAAGYERTREAVNMTVDLATAPLDTAEQERLLTAQGLTIRPLTGRDQPGFGEWMRGWGGSWQAEAALALARPTGSVHVAVRETDGGTEYLGFACQGSNRRSWFGPMGTEESLRGRGVGAVLLRRCLADQRAAGLTSAEIGWTGPLRFYSRTVGAAVGRVFWLYAKEPGEASRHARTEGRTQS